MKTAGIKKTVVHETRRHAHEHHFCQKDLKEQVEKLAYELYEKRGCLPGRDMDDWLQAERIIQAKK